SWGTLPSIATSDNTASVAQSGQSTGDPDCNCGGRRFKSCRSPPYNSRPAFRLAFVAKADGPGLLIHWRGVSANKSTEGLRMAVQFRHGEEWADPEWGPRRRTFIYLLRDPFTDEVRYVGYTDRGRSRYRSH